MQTDQTPIFEWPVRVYYEDTDAGGVVYHATYLNFLERARTEWLRSYGIELDRMADEEGVLFVVSRVEVDFRRSARFNDALIVTVALGSYRRASLQFEQHVRRQADGAELIRGQVTVACINKDSWRPTPIPEIMMRAIQE